MMTDRRARGHTAAVPSIPGVPETILVAPDSFKGTMSAVEVADAIGEGLRKAGRPVDLCPVADGGEGTLAALLAAFGGDLEAAAVSDPLGREIEASFALVSRARDRKVAIVEMAARQRAGAGRPRASAMRSPRARSAPGELIAAAVERGAEVVYVGVGGSATTDGGAGAIKAIRQAGGLRDAKLVVLCDVRTVFEDAARIFGPQKGAGKDDVRRLTKRLNDMAGRLDRDPRGVPMTGAAGGLSGGLWAAFGAELVPGPRSSSTRSSSTPGCGPPGRWSPARGSSTSRASPESSSRRSRPARASPVCRATRSSARASSTRSGARVLDLQVVLEAGTPAQLRAAAQRLAELL